MIFLSIYFSASRGPFICRRHSFRNSHFTIHPCGLCLPCVRSTRPGHTDRDRRVVCVCCFNGLRCRWWLRQDWIVRLVCRHRIFITHNYLDSIRTDNNWQAIGIDFVARFVRTPFAFILFYHCSLATRNPRCALTPVLMKSDLFIYFPFISALAHIIVKRFFEFYVYI